MIADIFKEIYQGQQADDHRKRGERGRGQKIPRAEPVEEEESD